MRPSFARLVAISLVTLCGCDPPSPSKARLAFAHPVILAPEKADFGFVGKWRPAPDPVWSVPGRPDLHEDPQPPPLMIEQVDDGSYSLVELVERGDGLHCSCRAISLSDSGFVLIEVEPQINKDTRDLLGLPEGIRFFVVAKREGDNLFFQHICSDDLAIWMAAEGYVLEISPPGIGGALVDAEPAELLECMQKHWPELCGEPTAHWIREKR